MNNFLKGRVFLALLIFLITILYSLSQGVESIPLNQLLFSFDSLDDTVTFILFEIRIPRILFAFLIGASLGLAGTVIQTLFLNPLAEPHLIGISSGAALGNTLGSCLATSFIWFPPFLIGAFSYLFSFISIALILFLGSHQKKLSMYAILLLGVILNSFYVSIIILLQTMMDSHKLSQTYLWLIGNLSYIQKASLMPLLLLFLLCFLLLFLLSKQLDIYSFGEKKAASLGVEIEKLKWLSFLLVSLLVATAVSLSGLIGFVGLVVPHICRLLYGFQHRKLLPWSCFWGGCLLLLSDTLARTLFLPQEIPVGAITALLGAPFFIFLLKSKKHYGR